MAKIKKRRVHWTPSNGENVVGYRLYWSLNGEVAYDSEFADVGNVTELVLPDDIPSFPLVDGNVGLGITAINEIGNESDLTKSSVFFQFIPPEAPKDLWVEVLQEFHFHDWNPVNEGN